MAQPMQFKRANMGDDGMVQLFNFGLPDGEGLRNGSIKDIKPMHVSTGLAPEYRIVIAAGADQTLGLTFIDMYRVQGRFYEEKLIAGGMNAATARTISGLLAFSRMTICQIYALDAGDFIDVQTVKVVLVPEVPATTGAVFTARVPAYLDEVATGGTAAGTMTAAIGADFWDIANPVAVGIVSKCAIAAVVVNGIFVATNGHHFLTNASDSSTGKQAFNGFKDQFLTVETTPVATQLGLTEPEFIDTVFHKAAHPVNDVIFESLMSSATFKERINALGYGSLAIRLPLKSDKTKALSSLTAIIMRVEPITTQLNVSMPPGFNEIDYHIMEAIKMCPDVTTRAEFDRMRMTQRDSVLTPYLDVLYPHVATLLGVFQGFGEANQVRLNDTLAGSHTHKMLAEEHGGLLATGQAHGRAAAKHLKAGYDAGGLTGLGVGGAAAPATRAAVHDPRDDKMHDLMRIAFGSRVGPGAASSSKA